MNAVIDNTQGTMNARLMKEFTRRYQERLSEQVIDTVQGKTNTISFSQMVDIMAEAMSEIGFSEGEINEITVLKNDTLINKHFENIEKSVDEDVFKVSANKSDIGNKFEEAYANFVKATTPTSTFEELKNAGSSILNANSFFVDIGKGLYDIKLSAGRIKKTIKYNNLLSVAKRDLALAGSTSREATLEAEMIAYDKVSKGKDEIVPVTKELLWRKNVEKSGTAKGRVMAKQSAFQIFSGGKDFVSGFDELKTLEDRYKSSEITQSEYERQKHYINLNISSGFFSSAKGIADVGAYISYRIASKASTETAEKVGRFAPVAGNILGVMSGINGVVQKGLKAHEALTSGNGGRAAMYAVSASLDIVNVALNSIAAALDLIPGIGTVASFVIDIIATIVDIFSTLIEAFADLVDTRTDEQKLQQAFDKLVNSKEFKQQVKSMSESFANQGYDVFKYIIDTKAADLDTPSESTRDLVAAHTELVNLTEQAKQKANELRIAMIDNSFKNNMLEGGALNDYIRVVGGGDKTIDGKAGNDILIGGLDRQLIIGGEGDDYLDGGEGSDSYESGPGDDTVAIQPSVDIYAIDTAGTDTILVHENDTVNLSRRLLTRKNPEKFSVYTSLLAGNKTLSNGDPLSNHMIETDSITVDLSQKKASVGLSAEFKITNIHNYDFNRPGFFNSQGYPNWKAQLQDLMRYHDLRPSSEPALEHGTTNFDRTNFRTSTYSQIAYFINSLNSYSGNVNFVDLNNATKNMTAVWQKGLLSLFKTRSTVTVDEVASAMSSFLNEVRVYDDYMNSMSGDAFFEKYNKEAVKLVPSRFAELGSLLNALSDAVMKKSRNLIDVSTETLKGKDFWLLASDKEVSYITDGTYIYERRVQPWGSEYKRSDLDISKISEDTALVKTFSPKIHPDFNGKYSPVIDNIAEGEFAPERRMMAELYLRFKNTAITGYENVIIKDVDKAKFDKIYGYKGANKANSDLSIQLTGDNKNNYLSINESASHQKANYLSGKEGDDILHVERYADLQKDLKGKLVLDGGMDVDTVILSYSLKDKNKTLDSFSISVNDNGASNSDIVAGNVENFVVKTNFNANGGVIDLSNYSIDKSGGSSLNGIALTIDSKINNLEVKTTSKSDVININNLGDYGHIINNGGSDILNLTNLDYADGVKVNLNSGYVKGQTDIGPKISLDNINSVIASKGNDELLGNDNANFIYTDGGNDIAIAGKGNDVLSTSTGDHTLIGGEGQDRYIINTGKAKVLQSLSLSRDNRGLYKINDKALNGNMSASFKISEGDVFFGESGNPINNIKIMMGVRDVTKYFSARLKNNNELVIESSNLEPLHLKNNERVVINFEYNVANNRLATARVRDLDQGNEIVFNNINDINNIRPEITDKGELVFRDIHSDSIIFRDLHWLDLSKEGVSDLQTLSNDFATRFSKLSFAKVGTVVEGKDVSNWLMDSFDKFELHTPRGPWDLYIKLSSYGRVETYGGHLNDTFIVDTPNSDVYGRDGNNVYNVTRNAEKAFFYRTDRQDNYTKLKSGNGNNIVNIAADADFSVAIYNSDNGKGDILNIDGVSTSAISVGTNPTNDKRFEIRINDKSSAYLNENDVEKITVQDGEKTWIVSDVSKFLHQSTTQGAPKYHWSEYINKNGQLGLSFDAYRPQDISVKIFTENDMTNIEFISGKSTLYKGAMATHSQNVLSINTIAKDMAAVYTAGISFQQGTMNLRADGMTGWLTNLLADQSKTTVIGYQLRLENSGVATNSFSSVEGNRNRASTAKLTSNMAAFDAANSDMVGTRRHMDSSTVIQPTVTNVN